MTSFSPTVEEFWRRPLDGASVLQDASDLLIAAQPELADDRRLSILERPESTLIVLTPELADRLELSRAGALSLADFRAKLTEAAIALHGADAVHYFADDAKAGLLAENAAPGIRLLTDDDRDAFALFEASASEQDLDDAYVEIDHWAVVGAFDGDRLVCAASAYPWSDSRLADIGVLTLAESRGRGLARGVVRELARVVIAREHEPQYRTQIDHTASKAVAAGAELTWFGDWDVIAPGDEEPAAATLG